MIVPDKLIKSPMNYTGGKFKLLKQILPLFPDRIDGRFIDLFTGGANVAVNVDANRIIANDYDENVIGIYRKMQSMPVEEIIAYIDGRIGEYGLSITDVDAYNRFRVDYNSKPMGERNPLDLFVLICYSFNHQFRFNRDGEFNMPFGKERSQFNDTIRKNLVSFRERIEGITFTVRSFVGIKVEKLSNDDFVYCDPPYLITCATYNEKDGWNETLEHELLSMLDRLNDNGVRFALSNALSSKGRTNEILTEWSCRYNVHHLANSYGNCSYHTKDRSGADEVLITNY